MLFFSWLAFSMMRAEAMRYDMIAANAAELHLKVRA